MNRQKEFTEEGRYTPISKAESRTYKCVWVISDGSTIKVTLKTDEVEGIGTAYTSDDPIYDTDTIAITRGGESGPEALTDTSIATKVGGGESFYVDEFDGEDGILPLYLQVTANMPA